MHLSYKLGTGSGPCSSYLSLHIVSGVLLLGSSHTFISESFLLCSFPHTQHRSCDPSFPISMSSTSATWSTSVCLVSVGCIAFVICLYVHSDEWYRPMLNRFCSLPYSNVCLMSVSTSSSSSPSISINIAAYALSGLGILFAHLLHIGCPKSLFFLLHFFISSLYRPHVSFVLLVQYFLLGRTRPAVSTLHPLYILLVRSALPTAVLLLPSRCFLSAFLA